MYINKKNNRAQTTIIHMSSSLPYFYLRTHDAFYSIARYLSVSDWSADDSHQFLAHEINAWKATPLPYTPNVPLFGYFQLFQQIFILHLNVATGCCGYRCWCYWLLPMLLLLFVQSKWHSQKWERENGKKREYFPSNQICYNNNKKEDKP